MIYLALATAALFALLSVVLALVVVAQNVNTFILQEKVEKAIMAVKDAIEEIAAEVTVLQGKVASSNALLTRLAGLIEASAGDEAAARALAAEVRAQSQSLSDAVAANDGDPDTNPTPTNQTPII